MNTSSKSTRDIDPRGPRFGAGITALLLLITIVLGLVELPLPGVYPGASRSRVVPSTSRHHRNFCLGHFCGDFPAPLGISVQKTCAPPVIATGVHGSARASHLCSASGVVGHQCGNRVAPCGGPLWPCGGGKRCLYCSVSQFCLRVVPRVRALCTAGESTTCPINLSSGWKSAGRPR